MASKARSSINGPKTSKAITAIKTTPVMTPPVLVRLCSPTVAKPMATPRLREEA